MMSPLSRSWLSFRSFSGTSHGRTSSRPTCNRLITTASPTSIRWFALLSPRIFRGSTRPSPDTAALPVINAAPLGDPMLTIIGVKTALVGPDTLRARKLIVATRLVPVGNPTPAKAKDPVTSPAVDRFRLFTLCPTKAPHSTCGSVSNTGL